MYNNSAISAYKKVSLDTAVAAASPHQLINMLFNGTQESLNTAKYAMSANNISLRGESISKAINIITNGLEASLDYEKGGDLAIQLGSLYQYMSMQLLKANLKNDTNIINEVSHLIEEIHSAWRSIGPTSTNMMTQ